MSDAKTAGTATLTVDGQTIELPILEGTEGPKVIDVRKLYAQSGMFTYDPSYTSTASCDSALTYIDGEVGFCATVAIPSKSWPPTAVFWKCVTSCSIANCPTSRNSPISSIRSPITR